MAGKLRFACPTTRCPHGPVLKTQTYPDYASAPSGLRSLNTWGKHAMKVSDAIAEILRREGVETVIGYPVNHILERGAAAGIRPIIVRQERIGLHMAEAMSRVTSGRQMGVFVMQHGPGTENAYGGVAQAFSESVPILVMPGGYARRLAWVERNYNASVQMRGITKSA